VRLEEFPHLSGEERQQKSDALAETLVLIRGMLPEAAQGEALPQLAAEMVRLSQVIAGLLSPAFPDSREARQLALVERWRKIFGKQEEFARPILETRLDSCGHLPYQRGILSEKPGIRLGHHRRSWAGHRS